MSKANKRLYIITLASNILRVVVSVLVGMLLVPMNINYWEAEQYSIWLIINSILAYLSMSNLGMNAAASILINKTQNHKQKIAIFRKSFVLISISAVVLIIALILMNYFVSDWVLIMGKISDNYLYEAQMSCLILSLTFLLNVPFSIFSSVITGFHKVYVENIFQIVGYIVSIGALALNIFIGGNLIVFAYLIGLSKLGVNILRFIYFKLFLTKTSEGENIGIATKDDNYSYSEIFILGIRCFIGGVASLVVLNTDNLVISHFLGVKEVTPYAVTFKVFSVLFSVIYVFNSSIIPVIGWEIGKNNMSGVKKIYQRTYYLILWIGGGIWIGSFIFFKTFILAWAGQKAFAGILVVFIFGAYSYLFALANLNNIIINTLNYIKESVWVVVMEAIINLGLSIILIKHWGLVGVAFGTFAGTLLAPTIFFPIIINKKSRGVLKQDTFFMLKHFVVIAIFLFLFSWTLKFNFDVVTSLLLSISVLLVYSILSYIILSSETKKYYLSIVKNIRMHEKG